MKIYNCILNSTFILDRKVNIILIEGTDASGKKSQSEALEDHLTHMGIPSERIEIPAYYTASGKIVGQCYLGKSLGLGEEATALFGDPLAVDPRLASGYYALNRLQEEPRIESLLEQGIIPILDRWVEANMGHQGSKIGNKSEREKLFRWLWDLEYGLFKLPQPDLKVFLHMPAEVAWVLNERRAKELGRALDGHEASFDHLKRAEEAYLHLIEFYPGFHTVECAPSGKIDSLRTPEDIHKEIYNLTLRELGLSQPSLF